jgi:hypothetical protein
MEPEIKISFVNKTTRETVIKDLELGIYFKIEISIIYSNSFSNIYLIINPYQLKENINELFLFKDGVINEMDFNHHSSKFLLKKYDNYWKIVSIPIYADLAGCKVGITNKNIIDNILDKLIIFLQDIANNIPDDM